MKTKNLSVFFGTIALIAVIVFTTFFGVSAGAFKIDPVTKMLKLGLDIEGGVVVVFEAKTDQSGTDLKKTMDQTKGVIERRINELGLTEPIVTVQGDKRIRVELPGVSNAEQAVAMIGKTAKLEFIQVDPSTKAMEGMSKADFKGTLILGGTEVKDSGYTLDQYGNPAINLEFNSAGVKKFADSTKFIVDNYGRGQIAIILDDKVISAPFTEVVIPDGKAIITGSFTTDEATGLASLIRGGALPVDLEEVQSSVIGPTLGLDALNTSVKAAQIGFALVLLYMIIYYRLPGVVAGVALSLYCAIVFMILVGLNATLTLPGIAGIVLSVGMAVDANVITFERIKEEIRNGKTLRASIESGFKRAFWTIFDSNITTIIAALVLFSFGEGPIRGFAITLMVGIVSSMFTAIVVTRVLLKAMNGANLMNNYGLYGVNEAHAHEDAHKAEIKPLKIVENAKYLFGASALVMVVGLVLAMTVGMNKGIDFTGGTMLQIDIGKTISVAEANEVIKSQNLHADIQHAGTDKTEIIIKTKQSLDTPERTAIFDLYKEKYGLKDEAFRGSEQFGPSIGAEIQNKALIAILIASVCMLIYITFRFEYVYGVAAIIALIHDVLILLAVYAIFRVPLNSTFIAAVLTIVGYSINDTIVVFDRVRENVKIMKRATFTDIANISVTQTVARSINTSLTTVLVILALYVMGVPSIKEFTFPLIIGITVGTFSSVGIASPIWAIWKSKEKPKNI